MLTRVVSGLYGGKRAEDFAGKPASGAATHPVGILTRVVSGLYGGRRAGSFAGKTSGGGGTHPVGEITRITSGLWGARRTGSFAGRDVAAEHPVGELTRVVSGLWGGRLVGSFAGRSVTTVEEHHGKGDNDGRKRHKSIIKPTGLLARKNVKIGELEKEQHQVVEQVLKGLSKAPEVRENIEVVQMSLAEIDFEIKVLLHKQFRTQEDEAMLLILLAANI